MSVSSLFSLLFVYTPFPWIAILCIILYRHDLSRLFHPFKDRCSTRDIKLVFQKLELPFKVSSSSRRRIEKNRAIFWVAKLRTNISERFPSTGLYAFVFVILAGSSLLSTLVVEPLLFGEASFLNPRFDGLVSSAFQIVSVLPSIFAMQRYFGPFPSAPKEYHLKKRRLGSLVRYCGIC
jgi:hypothetical protein